MGECRFVQPLFQHSQERSRKRNVRAQHDSEIVQFNNYVVVPHQEDGMEWNEMESGRTWRWLGIDQMVHMGEWDKQISKVGNMLKDVNHSEKINILKNRWTGNMN